MASLLWYLSTLHSSVYLLSCHLCQAQKEKIKTYIPQNALELTFTWGTYLTDVEKSQTS